jgi:YbgC/YbaW family acyl-CoA thioester hydrolase
MSDAAITTTAPTFRFTHRLRVRWAEVDMQKIVFNGHYLMYLDTAVADYWRALALPYEATMHDLAGDLYVKKAALQYHASARYDDQLSVGLRCARIGTSSMVFEGMVMRDGTPLVEGELIYVFADPATQKSRPVPQQLRDVLQGFEAGQPMVNVRCGAWADLQQPASAVRHAVFVQEQGFAWDIEIDAHDATATHAVLFNRLGRPLATGRMFASGQPGVAQIGRVAVERVLRGSGLGEQIMRALMDAARQQGFAQVLLHSQTTAQPFYARLGYTPQGEPFMEEGVPHITMVLRL